MSAPPETPRRSRKRLVWLLATAPLVLALLVVGGYFVLLPVTAQRGLFDYAEEDYASAADRFASQQTVNVVEPWKAYFNEGTAHLREDTPQSLAASLSELDDAYALSAGTPPETRCMVQTNLALAHEISGDEAMAEGNAPRAAEHYATAQEVRAQEGCPQTEGEQKQQNEDATDRLEQKQQDAEDAASEDPPDDPSDPGEDPQPPQSPEEKERQQQLEEQNRDAQQQRDQQQQQYNDWFGDPGDYDWDTPDW